MTRAFADLFGVEPDGTWSAPGRVNLVGEYTDYNEGFVLPTALPLAARATAARRTDGVIKVASAQGERAEPVEARIADLRPGAAGGWSSYVLGVAWALADAGHTVAGADLYIDSDVPIGAGLSSSAALECATALALAELSEIDLDRTALARLAQRAENEFVGVPCGVLDQMASLLCVPGHALLLDTRSLEMRQVPFDLESAGLALLVVDTRVGHDLGNSGYTDRRRACERAASVLGVAALRDVGPDDLREALGRLADPELVRRVRHVVTEDARVLDAARLLDEGRVAEIGPILNAAHASIRDDFESSCAELDAAVEAAIGAGALGARMIGGGFGGSAIALVGADATASIALAVEARFTAAGWRAPLCFVAAPVCR